MLQCIIHFYVLLSCCPGVLVCSIVSYMYNVASRSQPLVKNDMYNVASRSQPLVKNGGPGPMPIPELYPLQRTVQTNQIAERGLRHVVYTYGFSHCLLE